MDNETGKKILDKIHFARTKQLNKRVNDARFVLDKMFDHDTMNELFKRNIKFCEVFAAGHSFGACTVYMTAYLDKRISQIVLYDPYLLPIPEEALFKSMDIPILVIGSETFKNREYNETIPRLRKIMSKENNIFAIDLLGSEHLS